ncbi:hypothetical protein AB4Z22_45755, partial [Paenibacillus sp. TAF58]
THLQRMAGARKPGTLTSNTSHFLPHRARYTPTANGWSAKTGHADLEHFPFLAAPSKIEV